MYIIYIHMHTYITVCVRVSLYVCKDRSESYTIATMHFSHKHLTFLLAGDERARLTIFCSPLPFCLSLLLDEFLID